MMYSPWIFDINGVLINREQVLVTRLSSSTVSLPMGMLRTDRSIYRPGVMDELIHLEWLITDFERYENNPILNLLFRYVR